MSRGAYGKRGTAVESKVGDRVFVVPGKEHAPEHKGKQGTVLIQNGVIGVKFDGIAGVHKWYTPDELTVVSDGVRAAYVDAQRTALPGEDNHGFIDRFTAAHASFGVLAGLGRLPWWATLASGLFFDLVIERQFKDKWPELWPNSTQDTWANITGDTIAMMLGWKIAKMLPEGKKPMHTTIRKELP